MADSQLIINIKKTNYIIFKSRQRILEPLDYRLRVYWHIALPWLCVAMQAAWARIGFSPSIDLPASSFTRKSKLLSLFFQLYDICFIHQSIWQVNTGYKVLKVKLKCRAIKETKRNTNIFLKVNKPDLSVYATKVRLEIVKRYRNITKNLQTLCSYKCSCSSGFVLKRERR